MLATDTFNQFIDLDANIMHLINVDLSPLQVGHFRTRRSGA